MFSSILDSGKSGASNPDLVATPLTSPALFTFPNRILFGAGARAALLSELARWQVERPLVVTDPGLVASGIVEMLTSVLQDAVVFSDILPNPTETDVLAGLGRYRETHRDGLIAVGGGSAIDASKGIRLLTTHLGILADYDVTHGGMDRISVDLPPMIAIPTTAGTGAEVGRGALIQLPGIGRKVAVLSPFLLPSTAICDSELTHSLSPELTAGTGMDAFVHCVESYLSTTFHPICDGIALEGLRHVFKGLEAAVRDGGDRAARSEMMLGALLGGISFHKGLGVIHSLSHALGSEGRVHHGTLNAILLPHALRFNLPAAEARLTELAGRLGLGRGGDAPGHLIILAELILARLPLPRRLGQIEGLRQDRISEYSRLALLDHCHRTNPRACGQQEMEELLERAW